MDFDIFGRTISGCEVVVIALFVVLFAAVLRIMHSNFLHERVGEAFHGRFAGGVRGVAGQGKEGKGRRGEDDVP